MKIQPSQYLPGIVFHDCESSMCEELYSKIPISLWKLCKYGELVVFNRVDMTKKCHLIISVPSHTGVRVSLQSPQPPQKIVRGP